MKKIVQLHSQYEVENMISRINLQKGAIEEREYLVAWFAEVARLNPEQERLAREKLNIPEDKLKMFQKRREILGDYTHSNVGGNK